MNLQLELERVRAKIIAHGNYQDIAKRTGLTQSTIARLASAKRQSCNTDTLQLLHDFFRGLPLRPKVQAKISRRRPDHTSQPSVPPSGRRGRSASTNRRGTK